MCTPCGSKFTDDRWEETTGRTSRWHAGDLTVCGTCRADDIAREKAAAEEPWEATQPEPEPDHDQEEPGRLRGLFRRRT